MPCDAWSRFDDSPEKSHYKLSLRDDDGLEIGAGIGSIRATVLQ